MTSYSYSKVTCPDCGQTDTCPLMASTNSSGWRQWSDGWGRGGYCQTEAGVLACRCGAVFTADEGNPEYDGMHRPSSPQTGMISQCRPEDVSLAIRLRLWRSEGTERLVRLQCWWDIEEEERMQSPLADAAISALPPGLCAPAPHPEENVELLASADDFGRQRDYIMRGLRRLDERIAEHKAYEAPPTNWSPADWAFALHEAEMSRHALSGELLYLRPPCVLPPDTEENMERLLGLLALIDGHSLVRGDILRRLGRFDEAIATYAADGALPARWSALLCELAANGHSELVELPVGTRL
ncbi:hypothetical protein [Sphingopyxis witflariensis]|uniref:hypothetical protein n=1 Tax=Sphingopyxis witflariensis TaxID=173675 RepID=UPI001181BF0D|nr:hypothetical protein [Sphingopyxis witflariensis]